jgi:hypothetical protein
LEQNSQVETIIILESQIRECYGRVAYTHKTHEKCADIIKKRNDRLKIWQIILSALITSSFLAKVFGSTKIGDIDVALVGGAIISVVLLALNTYLKDYDLGELMQKHSNCATELWSIRETYLSLLTDIKARLLTPEEIVEQRNELQEKLTGIYMGSPRTINKAYAEAQKALKVDEELTFSQKEIDVMLPEELRREKI